MFPDYHVHKFSENVFYHLWDKCASEHKSRYVDWDEGKNNKLNDPCQIFPKGIPILWNLTDWSTESRIWKEKTLLKTRLQQDITCKSKHDRIVLTWRIVSCCMVLSYVLLGCGKYCTGVVYLLPCWGLGGSRWRRQWVGVCRLIVIVTNQHFLGNRHWQNIADFSYKFTYYL